MIASTDIIGLESGGLTTIFLSINYSALWEFKRVSYYFSKKLK
jgi:hypothetical protein